MNTFELAHHFLTTALTADFTPGLDDPGSWLYISFVVPFPFSSY